MKIDIISIFPEFFDRFLDNSIIKSALIKDKVKINIINLRDYSKNKHNKVDDTPYGGGAGMLMQFPPIYDAIMDLKKDNTKVIYLSPQGKLHSQGIAIELASYQHLIFICGHYEGIDERVLQFVDYEISIGDYVLTGGELAAMVVTDSIVRLLPGVIEEESVTTDSLYNGLLKYPQYTKPEEYMGYKVPEVLLSGHHQNIAKWREYMSVSQTLNKRPDLLEGKELNNSLKKILEELKK
ncbi:tRNA (guanosine(37)-N1)-methyltransferase TrmD [Acholeplasma sp. OttesenSCG-928-E16]|nr:tRNA (guanosine(37)-N1)-methyltransferase TrmD [Acholeplasma sp. OttesenSCG-928-E16]